MGHSLLTLFGSGPQFSPAQSAAVTYWLDAGTITGVADGGTISASNLVDRSQFARGALATANSILYRANAGNGRPAIEFDGSASYARSSSFVVPQPLTVFIVLKQVTWVAGHRFFDGGSVNKVVLNQNVLTPKIGMYSAATVSPSDDTTDLGYVSMIEAFYNGASSTIESNGNTKLTGSPGTNGFTDGMTLGAAGNLSAGFFANYQLFELIVCDSTLSVSDKAAIRSYLLSKQALTTRSVLVCDGNSLTAGQGAPVGQDYPTQLLARLGGVDYYRSFNFGVSGQSTPQMTSDAASQVDPQVRNFARKILIAWEITNDLTLNSASAATAYSNFVTYCAGRRAAGFTVIALTVLPRQNFTTQNRSDKNTINASLRADFNVPTSNSKVFTPAAGVTYADYLVDVAADSRIGDDGDELDTTYYSDGIHLNTAGYAIIADYAKAAIDMVA